MGTASKLCPVITEKCYHYEAISFTEEGEAVSRCKHPSNKSGKPVRHLCPNADLILGSVLTPKKSLTEKGVPQETLEKRLHNLAAPYVDFGGAFEQAEGKLEVLTNLSVCMAKLLVSKGLVTEEEVLELFSDARY